MNILQALRNTSVKMKEYVDKHIVQADWYQDDTTANDYIKNKTHRRTTTDLYCSDVVSEIATGTTLIKDLSNIDINGVKHYLGADVIMNPDSYYAASVDGEFTIGTYTGKMTNDFTRNFDVKIDDVNYKIKINASYNTYVYVIIDVNALTEEYSTKFSSAGVYFEKGERDTRGYSNLKLVSYEYEPLNRRYIPSIIARTEDVTKEINALSSSAVLTTLQELTDEQKAQARENIEAKPSDLRVNITSSYDVNTDNFIYTCDTPFADMAKAYESGASVLFSIGESDTGLGIYLKDVPISSTETECRIILEKNIGAASGIKYETFIIHEDGSVTYSYKMLIAADAIKGETGTSVIPMSQKATTDALELKADILSKEEMITLLTETGFISPATTASGDIYTDSDGDVYVM